MLKLNITYVSAEGTENTINLFGPSPLLKHSNPNRDTLDLYLLDDGSFYTKDEYPGIVLEINKNNCIRDAYSCNKFANKEEESRAVARIFNNKVEFRNLDIRLRQNMDVVLYALIFDAKNIHYVPKTFLRENKNNYVLWTTVLHHNVNVLTEGFEHFKDLYLEILPKSSFLFLSHVATLDKMGEKDKETTYFSAMNASLFPVIKKYYSLSKDDIVDLLKKNPSIFFYLDEKYKDDMDINFVFQKGCMGKLDEIFTRLLKDGTIVKI